MLYTGKGDDGTTGLFGCNQRISKSSRIAEALGTLDEVNAYLGVCKVVAQSKEVDIDGVLCSEYIDAMQQNLFIIQSQIAGANKEVSSGEIRIMEQVIAYIERTLPDIHSFFVPGGEELSVCLDYARTIARRAERRVVDVLEEEVIKVKPTTLTYLNRLSSMLYALVRFVNFRAGVVEEAPTYGESSRT